MTKPLNNSKPYMRLVVDQLTVEKAARSFRTNAHAVALQHDIEVLDIFARAMVAAEKNVSRS